MTCSQPARPNPANDIEFMTTSTLNPSPDSDSPALRVPIGAQLGEPCPKCKQGQMEYNSVLDLECSSCGYTESGGAGCT